MEEDVDWSHLLEVKILELELSLDDARGLDTGAQNILHNRGLLGCDEEACKHPPHPRQYSIRTRIETVGNHGVGLGL